MVNEKERTQAMLRKFKRSRRMSVEGDLRLHKLTDEASFRYRYYRLCRPFSRGPTATLSGFASTTNGMKKKIYIASVKREGWGNALKSERFKVGERSEWLRLLCQICHHRGLLVP